jgi:putative zinc finger/helix-turn-helix YgiT family protein
MANTRPFFHFTKRDNMTERRSCPTCETLRDVELVNRDEKVTIKGREVSFVAHLYRCTHCGTEFEDPGQLDANLEAARETYARLYESPTAEDIIKLRSGYGASQKAFGLILGFGELTVNSYEHGSAPGPANRLLLRLAENPVVFRAMYAQNRTRISALQRKRMEQSTLFRSADAWTAVEALAARLTPAERSKAEECAKLLGVSVVDHLTASVRGAAAEDLGHLVREATWTTWHPNPLPDGRGAPVLDPLEAAS